MINTSYILKSYDTPLLKFLVGVNEYGQQTYSNIVIAEQYKHLLPPGVQAYGIEHWLKARIIPKNREYVHELLKSIGSPTNPIDIVDITMGLSVIDTYWIVPEGFKGKFKDYNLYENNFSKALSLIAFTGVTGETFNKLTTSPEFTTNGMLRKCWRRVDGKLYLYKAGTHGASNTGMEPYSEYYACQVAKAMGLSAVEYDLKRFKKQLVSVCEAFTNINTGFTPIGTYTKTRTISEIAGLYGQSNMADLITFDAIICNEDRHTGNYGFLRDNLTGDIKGIAPIFDSGLSLFNFAVKQDFINIDKYSKTRLNAFNADQVTMAKQLIGVEQRARLRQLINFRFKRHSSYNLPEWRLKTIEAFIYRRVRELLG